MTLLEFSVHLLFGGHRSLHPLMLKHFGQRWTIIWIKLKHSLDQVLKLLGEEVFATLLILAMHSPKDVSFFGCYTKVERVFGYGRRKGRVMRN